MLARRDEVDCAEGRRAERTSGLDYLLMTQKTWLDLSVLLLLSMAPADPTGIGC
jgi:hypothetical protein